MARRQYTLVCKECNVFFKTTRKKDKTCRKCTKKESPDDGRTSSTPRG